MLKRSTHGLLDSHRGVLLEDGLERLIRCRLLEAQHLQCSQSLVVDDTISRSRNRHIHGVGTKLQHLTRELHDNLLCSLETQTLNILKKHGILRSDNVLQLAGRVGREYHSRGVATYARDADKAAEQLALNLCCKAKECLLVLTNNEVNIEARLVCSLNGGVGIE